MKPTVKLISATPDAEKHIAYCARVSNPKNQENDNFEGLLKYCIKNQHWSIFEHAFLTVEINTSLAIATQILRHSLLHSNNSVKDMPIVLNFKLNFLYLILGDKIQKIDKIARTILEVI